MLVFALISEIPFNYLYYSSPVFPFHQNVMFTFFIALLLMLGLEKVRSKGTEMYILAAVLSLPVGYFLGTLGMVDYYGSGVVTVLIFYLCRQIPHGWIGEVAGLAFLNCKLLGGMTIPLTLGSWTLEFPEQGLALLALIPIGCITADRALTIRPSSMPATLLSRPHADPGIAADVFVRGEICVQAQGRKNQRHADAGAEEDRLHAP